MQLHWTILRRINQNLFVEDGVLVKNLLKEETIANKLALMACEKHSFRKIFKIL